MTSPFVVSPFTYNDSPAGGQPMPMVIAARAPSNTTDKQYPAGYLWLSSKDMFLVGPGGVITYGDGSLYYQAGNAAGVPSWTIISDGSSIVSINGTTNQITVTNNAGVVTLSIPVAFVAPGSITATLGNITATNGNIVRGTAGNKDVYTSVATTIAAGANSAGTVTLVAGEAVVSTTAVTAASQIRLYRQGVGATGAAALGIVTILTRSAGVSFTIRSVQPADATAAQATDVSVIGWEIVN